MNGDYRCPKCKATLNPDNNVILAAARENVNCMIGLHPQPGKYEVFLPPGVQTEDGTRWEFSCPICGESLTTREDENLCRLELTVEESNLQILFSCIAGEHATFITYEAAVREKYGENSHKYEPFGKKEHQERA